MGNSPSSHRRRASTTTTGPSAAPARRGSRNEMIPDNFTSIDQVTAALRRNGLESCNLIVGIDFTKSNEWSGKRTFGGRSLHTIDDPSTKNPYEEVIETIGMTLRDFDEDNSIPVYGFGDEFTADNSVFTFAKDQSSAGFPFEDIRSRYREIVPCVVTAGPTSFAPIIHEAISIVNRTGEYHILVIIADGQVTRSADIPAHAVSKNEKETIDAITLASSFPLSIVMVGVGDGPWDSMIYFDDYLVNRHFDNFQFVEFHKLMSRGLSRSQQLTQFALLALMEIPDQYKVIKELGYLNKGPYQFVRNIPEVTVFPTPQNHPPSPTPVAPALASASTSCSTNYSMAPRPMISAREPDGPPPASIYSQPTANAPSAPIFGNEDEPTEGTAGGAVSAATGPLPGSLERLDSNAELELSRLQESLLCSICEDRQKDTVFQCGHETCRSCSSLLTQCPTCRQDIQVRIRRYGL